MPQKLGTLRGWLIFSIPMILITIFGGFAYSNLASGKSPDTNHSDDLPPRYERMIQKIRTSGPIAIIVGFDPYYQAEPILTPVVVNSPPSDFDKLRQLFVQDLLPYKVLISENSFDWVIPYIAIGKVDEAAFRYILTLPYITSVEENLPQSPGITTPTPTQG